MTSTQRVSSNIKKELKERKENPSKTVDINEYIRYIQNKDYKK